MAIETNLRIPVLTLTDRRMISCPIRKIVGAQKVFGGCHCALNGQREEEYNLPFEPSAERAALRERNGVTHALVISLGSLLAGRSLNR